jgi:hypothetical protein
MESGPNFEGDDIIPLPDFKGRGESEQIILLSLKDNFLGLCQKMKTEIESGKYDAIISDDTGGRIPTLFM